MSEGGMILTAAQQRVLGSLLEKQRTVPGSYPLSLNALRTACNQSSSRDPVVDYDEETVGEVLRELKDAGLVRYVWVGKSQRTVKYHQLLTERLDLTEPEVVLLTVLLLRGPQAPGELRTRTERMHHFADRGAVEDQLAALAARPEPLVRELPRQAGQHDNRWMHLLGAPPAPAPGQTSLTLVDRECVLAAGPAHRDQLVRDTYDTLAAGAEVADAWPLDTFEEWFLGQAADLAAPGPVIDLGCGTGTAAAVLAEYGLEVTGLDVSEGMLGLARAGVPGVSFQTGDLRRVLRPATARGWGAVVCRRSLAHLAGSELGPAVAAAARVLTPEGVLALVVDVGEQVLPLPGTSLPLVLHDPPEVLAAVEASGATLLDWYLRGPERGDPASRSLLVLARV